MIIQKWLEMVEDENFNLKGVVMECPHCSRFVKAAKEFFQKMGGRHFLAAAHVSEKNGDSYWAPNVTVRGPFVVECDECHGSGFLITEHGRRLVAMLKFFLDDANLAELEKVFSR